MNGLEDKSKAELIELNKRLQSDFGGRLAKRKLIVRQLEDKLRLIRKEHRWLKLFYREANRWLREKGLIEEGWTAIVSRVARRVSEIRRDAEKPSDLEE